MRVAVVGGTGFVGSYIVDKLTAAKHEVSLLVRPGSEDKAGDPEAVQQVPGSIEMPESLFDLVQDCDAVIYCVGILRESSRSGTTFEGTQYDGVVRTVDAAVKNDVRRFLLMSANGVKIPGTRYQETKQRAEDLVRISNLESTIFRPSVIFGDPRGRMEFATQLYRDMVKKPLPAIGFFSGASPKEGAVLMSPVHVEDVADAFVNALTEPSTIGEIYELGGPETLSWTDMIRRIAEAAGRKKWVIPFPIAIMKIAALLLDWLPAFPVTRDQLTMLAEGNVADPENIETLIGRPPMAFTAENLDYLAAKPSSQSG